MKILVVDDDSELRALLVFALRNAGFLVVAAADAQAARQAAADELPDLVVLDLNLGREDGMTLIPELREGKKARPILVLSVRSTEEDLVRALDLGADDYLTKPFSPRTLLARIRALLRRSGIESPETLEAGEFTLEPSKRQVAIGGRKPVRLTPLELRLLQYLLARTGQTVTSERLLIHVWGSRGAEGDRQLLKQLVHRLRQKIELDPTAPRLLLTDPGEGYRLETGQPG